MKITAIETFAVSNGFTPPRPWLFCAVRTDAGLTGYSEFGSDGITRGLLGLVQIMESDPEQTPFRDELFTVLPDIRDGHMTIPAGPGWGTELNEAAARKHAWTP